MMKSATIEQSYSVICGAFSRPPYENELNAWQTYLTNLPQKFFTEVIMHGPEIWTERFPTVRQVISEVLRREKASRAQPERPKPSPYNEPDLDPNNRFAKLAEKWRHESIKLGLDPHKATPQDIFKPLRLRRLAAGGVDE